jgi:predicted Zn-dependent peptidase
MWDPPEWQGLAHFLEHMLCPRRPGAVKRH